MESNKPYTVTVLDAKYDTENGFLVINGMVEDLKERKIFALNKRDFTFKGDPNVPDKEMSKTAAMLKGKRIRIIVNDDPNRTHIDSSSQVECVSLFNETIKKELDDVSKGLTDDATRIREKMRRLSESGKIRF